MHSLDSPTTRSKLEAARQWEAVGRPSLDDGSNAKADEVGVEELVS